MKKIKKIAKNILFTFIFPFFFLFIFVFKIRIGYLPTDKIGDFSDVSNNFYLEIKENKINKFKVLWFSNNSICNWFLYKTINRYSIILNSFILHYSYEFLRNNGFKKFIIDKKYTNTKIPYHFHLTNKYKSLISFEGFEEEIKKIEEKYKISKNKIISFSVRTKQYHLNEMHKNSTRNYSIDKYLKVFKLLKEEKYKIFQINSEKIFNEKREINNYFLKPDLDTDNIIHSYLIDKSHLFISSPSGPVGLAIVLQKPILLINFTVWDHLKYCNPNFTKGIIFKKYKDISTGKLLNFRTVIEKKLYQKNYNEDLISDGIEVIENSEDEIYNAIIEILFNKKEDKIDKNDDHKILKKFMIFYNEHFKLNNVELKVSEYYLKMNRELFII